MTMDRLSNKKLGLTLSILILFIFFVIRYVFNAHQDWLILLAGLLAALAMIKPSLLLPINLVFTAITSKIGYLNNHILLGLFFLIVVLPVACFMKVIGRDSMCRKFSKSDNSYWAKIERNADKTTILDMF